MNQSKVTKSQTDEGTLDRRPIRSRHTRWADGVSRVLADRGVSPNAISVFGMFAAIVGGVMFGLTSSVDGIPQRILWLFAGLMCQVRLLCNLFDGMVAIRRNVASAVGELYNEVPDRVSDAAIFIGLGYAFSGDVVLGYLAALLSVFVAYVRAMAKSIGAPNDFCGPMAKPQRMALATTVAFYMAVIPNSWQLTWQFQWREAAIVLLVVVVACCLTALRRLSRAATFLRAVLNDHYGTFVRCDSRF